MIIWDREWSECEYPWPCQVLADDVVLVVPLRLDDPAGFWPSLADCPDGIDPFPDLPISGLPQDLIGES